MFLGGEWAAMSVFRFCAAIASRNSIESLVSG